MKKPKPPRASILATDLAKVRGGAHEGANGPSVTFAKGDINRQRDFGALGIERSANDGAT